MASKKTNSKGAGNKRKIPKETLPAKKNPKSSKPAGGTKVKDSGLSDKELKDLQTELQKGMKKSRLIEEDLQRMRQKLQGKAPAPRGKKTEEFYRNFVFKCGKCVSEFEHKPEISEIDYKITCPKCNKKHTLKLKPKTKEYAVKASKTIRIIRE